MKTARRVSILCTVQRRTGPNAEDVIDTMTAIQVTPSLAVHPLFSDGQWRISHIQLGLKCADCCCAIKAVALAEHISTLIDFSQSKQEIETAAKALPLGPVIRDFKCPNKHEWSPA